MKQARPSSLLLVSIGAEFTTSQVKRESCLKATLKSIYRITSAWSTSFDPALASTIGVVR